jgi:hypothetical protein
VYFISATGQRWKRAVGASLTIALLSAVAVVGITLFGSEVLAAWKTPGNAEQALASNGAFAGLLNFEAPAANAARLASERDADAKGKAQAGSVPQFVKNWKFTQNSLADNLLMSYTLYFQSLQLVSFEQNYLRILNNIATAFPSFAPLAKVLEQQVIAISTAFANILRAQQAVVNASIPPNLRPPPTVPASPSL